MKSRGTRFFCSAVVIGSAIAIGAMPVYAEDLHQDSQDSKGIVTPHRHGPASIRRLHFDGTAEANNWSGYAIAAATPPATATSPTGVTVTSVSGSWKVPGVTCSGRSSQYSSFWVGIDGWYSDTVEQIGTESDCSSGTPSYYAWYEFYPLDSYYACPTASGRGPAPACPLMELKAGDVISAAVNCTTSGTCTATITDESMSPPASFSTTFTPTRRTGTPQLSSGEWIAESPCCTNSGGFLPLANFSTAYYGDDYTSVTGTNFATVTASGATQGPAQIGSFFSDSPATWWTCTMVNQSYAIPDNGINPPPPPAADVMAAPSALSSDGSSFTVTWNSAGP
jgi:hypothetical protein